MLVRCAATLVLALAAVCYASPTWTFRRRFGGAFRLSPFSYYSAPSFRYSRANAGYGVAPAGYGGSREGRTGDSTIEAVESEPSLDIAADAPALEETKASSASPESSPVSAAASEPEAPGSSIADPTTASADSFAFEETKGSSASPVASPASKSTSASELEAEDSQIFFPGQLTPLEPKATDVFVPECDGVPFMALNKETGRCQFLMMRTECPENQWFILDHDTLEASCQPLPCAEHEVLFDGVCKLRDDATLCPEGMVVLVNEYGEGLCDCAAKNLYWPAHDRCYPAFRKGPCHAGYYLTVGEEGVECSENICFRDGAAFWKSTKRCYRIEDETDSPCALGRLDVNEETLDLECVEEVQFAIFDVPVVRCSKGSKLDYGGRCKRELYQKFRSTFSSNSARKSKCGEGFIAGASGRCLKAAKGAKLG